MFSNIRRGKEVEAVPYAGWPKSAAAVPPHIGAETWEGTDELLPGVLSGEAEETDTAEDGAA